MQCIRTIFVFETVNCFLDVFFKSPKLFSILHIPQTIPLYSVKLYFAQYRFLLRPGHGPIYEGGGGGQGRKPKLREERRNERHKSSENAQKSEIISVKKGADLNSRPLSKMGGWERQIEQAKIL